MQLAIARAHYMLPLTDLATIAEAARKCRLVLGHPPRVAALVASIIEALEASAASADNDSRREQLEKAVEHYQRMAGRLEARRSEAGDAELPNLDELIGINHERLRLLLARRSALDGPLRPTP